MVQNQVNMKTHEWYKSGTGWRKSLRNIHEGQRMRQDQLDQDAIDGKSGKSVERRTQEDEEPIVGA